VSWQHSASIFGARQRGNDSCRAKPSNVRLENCNNYSLFYPDASGIRKEY
jgi:hypothetical protein